MRKIFLPAILVLLFACSAILFAAEDKGSVALATQSTVNNESFAYNMAEKTKLKNQHPSLTFEWDPIDTAEIFRIVNNTTDKLTITVTPAPESTDDEGNMCFRHETNLQITRPFKISAHEIYSEKDFSIGTTWGQFVSSFTNDFDTTPKSKAFTVEGKEGKEDATGGHIAGLVNCYQYQFVIEILMEDEERKLINIDALEAGNYYADLIVRIEDEEDNNKNTQQNIRIKGYRGVKFEPFVIHYFSVQPGEHTYDVDLTKTGDSDYFEVARIDFNYYEKTDKWTKPNTDRFTVLLSPAPDPENANSVPFQFILQNSEYNERTFDNTMEYQIYQNNGGAELKKYKDYPNVVYQITVPYTDKTQEGGILGWFNKRFYQWTFNPNPLPVYIKLKPQTGQNTDEMASGFYHSDIYFFIRTKN